MRRTGADRHQLPAGASRSGPPLELHPDRHVVLDGVGGHVGDRALDDRRTPSAPSAGHGEDPVPGRHRRRIGDLHRREVRAHPRPRAARGPEPSSQLASVTSTAGRRARTPPAAVRATAAARDRGVGGEQERTLAVGEQDEGRADRRLPATSRVLTRNTESVTPSRSSSIVWPLAANCSSSASMLSISSVAAPVFWSRTCCGASTWSAMDALESATCCCVSSSSNR